MESEVDRFIRVWEMETKGTLKLLRSLPEDKYDFRPDAGGRSLGEMAWHLAELDAYVTYGIEKGGMDAQGKPPNIERPKKVSELAPRFETVHQEAVARVKKLKDEDFRREVPGFDGKPMAIGMHLWGALLAHQTHHRGQLHLMCRLAGGTPPGLYGPTREDMAARRG